MMHPDAAAVRSVILSTVAPGLAELGLAVADVADGFDLRAEGVVDSLGFVALVAELERRFGGPLDFDGLDPDHLTVVGPLSAYVASRCAAPQATPEPLR